MNDKPVLPEEEIAKARHPFVEAWEMFRKNHAAVAALVVLILIVLAAIFGPILYPTDPFEMVWAPFSPPGVDGFLLGTDYLGRDLVYETFNCKDCKIVTNRPNRASRHDSLHHLVAVEIGFYGINVVPMVRAGDYS